MTLAQSSSTPRALEAARSAVRDSLGPDFDVRFEASEVPNHRHELAGESTGL